MSTTPGVDSTVPDGAIVNAVPTPGAESSHEGSVHTKGRLAHSGGDPHNDRLNVLVVGFGDRVQRVLLPALRTLDTATVTTICDPDPQLEERIRVLRNAGLLAGPVRTVPALEHALEPTRFDVALVAAPHHLHQHYTQALSAEGIMVWKEKPFAVGLDHAVELARTGAPVRTLVHRPHGQLFQVAARMLPLWGRLLSYKIRLARQTGDYSGTWRASREQAGGGAIIDLGYHAFDLIARLAPQPATVYAVTSDSPAHRTAVEVEESAHLTLTHSGGCVGSVYVSRCDDRAEYVDLIAEGGRITLDGDTARIEIREIGGRTTTVEMTATDDSPQARMLHYHAATHRDRGVTRAETDIGVRATAMIDAAYNSLRGQAMAPVTVPILP
jgi:predicted dehydrogenase